MKEHKNKARTTKKPTTAAASNSRTAVSRSTRVGVATQVARGAKGSAPKPAKARPVASKSVQSKTSSVRVKSSTGSAPARARKASAKSRSAASESRSGKASGVALPAKTAVAKKSAVQGKVRAPGFVQVATIVDSSSADLLSRDFDPALDIGFLNSGEVYDDGEHAQWLHLREIAEVARRARELNARQFHPDFDGRHCIECDIEIPRVRLDLGKVKCVDCQAAFEEQGVRERRLSGEP